MTYLIPETPPDGRKASDSFADWVAELPADGQWYRFPHPIGRARTTSYKRDPTLEMKTAWLTAAGEPTGSDNKNIAWAYGRRLPAGAA